MALWTSRRALLAGVGGAALGGCANARVVGFDKENRSLDIANASEPRTLDPHRATGAWENNIIGNMFVGLTTENERAEPIPGVAERWITSEDGLVWTFYLRRARWSDGESCDAHDFQFSFRRIMTPATLSQSASMLFPIRNAQAVHRGELPPERLGVAAVDDRTLEVRLEYPAPYLLQLLKHYTAYPVPKHILERVGEDWTKPANVVVNGPFTLKRWWSNYIVHLEKNPRFFDAGSVALEHLYFYPQSDAQAGVRKVRAGEAGWATRFPSNQAEELRRELPDYVRVATYLTCSYFSFNTTRPPFNDARVRQAVSMAYDRDFVAGQIYRTGEQPAYKFIPPGVFNYPTTARYAWADAPIAERKLEAERLLRAAGYGPDNPLRFALSHSDGGDHPRVAVAARNDWNAIAPWVNVQLSGAENQAHDAKLRAKDFDVGDAAWVGDFNDAKNFLFLFESRRGAQNYPGYSNPAYDDLVRQSDFERDPERRGQLMAQAEQLLLDDAPICASVFLNSTNLVHPDLSGWVENLDDIHRARWFGIRDASMALRGETKVEDAVQDEADAEAPQNPPRASSPPRATRD